MTKQVQRIDINCDMGESYGEHVVGNDAVLFPYITSCNIACGFHGGDPLHIENTIRLAIQYGVRIGAHPSYPDREGFGRREMELPKDTLRAVVRYQVAALVGLTETLGGSVAYVKPHGALYNTAADDVAVARIIAECVGVFPHLALMGLPGSAAEHAANNAGIGFIAEAFADRRYDDCGRLVPRTREGAVIHNPEEAAHQALSLVLRKEVLSIDGVTVSVDAESICVHGDHPGTLEVLKAMHAVFATHQITPGIAS